MSKKLLIIGVLIVFFIFLFPAIITLIGDWLWFANLNLAVIFTTVLKNRVLLTLLTGGLTYLIFYLNLRFVYSLTKNKPTYAALPGQEGNTEKDIGKYLYKISLGIALLAAFFTGLSLSDQWPTVLKFIHQGSFAQTDPVFNRDLSFYIFTLPLIRLMFGWAAWVIFASGFGIVAFLAFQGAFPLGKKYVGIEKKVKRYFLVLGGIFALLLAGQILLIKVPNLLFSSTGPLVGASYADLHLRLFLYYLWAGLTAGAAVLLLVNAKIQSRKLTLRAVGLYLAVAVLVGIVPAIFQEIKVAPNELIKEAPYIARHIQATQQAFSLDKVQSKSLGGEATLTWADIENNQGTIKNIRLWEREPLLDTFGQIQEIRTYYDFVSIDNDRYQLDGDYRQVMLSPRELNSDNLPHSTFINQRLVFTHGYGLALGPVNEVTAEGLPLLFVRDLPPESSKESLQVTQPAIYYGELTDSWVIANTQAQEFDYPKGEDNIYTHYQGEGGVVLDNFWKKLFFALRFSSIKILMSDDLTEQSRIMYHRQIQERAQRAFPFLAFDSDPYLVVHQDGSLVWIYDAYTSSSDYPYSQFVYFQEEPVNYLRNSVKVVIDAYQGTVQAYIADEQDPLILTYNRIFPGVFRHLSEMPEDLRAHIRYPEDLFKVQTGLYTVFHMEEPQIFYNKEDQWEIPTRLQSQSDPMMRHVIMKVPGEEKEEFVLMIPFTPKGKDNLSAWMAARNDDLHYGELMVFAFPKQRLVFGPEQVINRINQDAEISQQISLWDQRGSEVVQGNLLVIPIEESLLYVRPLYLRAEGGKIPELKRVIVAYQNKIAMAETLNEAFRKVVAVGPETIGEGEEEIETEDVEPEVSREELIERAQSLFEQAQEAQRQGNWKEYGEYVEELGKALEELKD